MAGTIYFGVAALLWVPDKYCWVVSTTVATDMCVLTLPEMTFLPVPGSAHLTRQPYWKTLRVVNESLRVVNGLLQWQRPDHCLQSPQTTWALFLWVPKHTDHNTELAYVDHWNKCGAGFHWPLTMLSPLLLLPVFWRLCHNWPSLSHQSPGWPWQSCTYM